MAWLRNLKPPSRHAEFLSASFSLPMKKSADRDPYMYSIGNEVITRPMAGSKRVAESSELRAIAV